MSIQPNITLGAQSGTQVELRLQAGVIFRLAGLRSSPVWDSHLIGWLLFGTVRFVAAIDAGDRNTMCPNSMYDFEVSSLLKFLSLFNNRTMSATHFHTKNNNNALDQLGI